MHDETDTGESPFDFDELADLLVEQGLQSSPSELHGCLTGLLAAGAGSQPEVGLDALSQALDLVLHGELAEQAMRLYTVTSAALLDEEFDFHPLLPDDDMELEERTTSLGLWSRGFLAGFAHASAGSGQSRATLSGDSSEILKDFAAITQAEVDEEDDEEESEASYAELLEYVRFGALNVFMDCAANSPGEQLPEGGEYPLH